jgi:ubiquinone/menaquinone biosynthesis C-methylase UbiE
MIPDALHHRYYGDPKYDFTQRFFALVQTAAAPDARVLNLGAGPGTNDPRCTVKGKFAEVVGADIDPVVLQNPEVDRSVVTDGMTLPFPDASFDMAFSDFVLEHVEKPTAFLKEVHRVLKPGSSYVFRTPNMYHYVAIASRLTPHRMHKLLANRMRRLAEDEHEPWPTYYRINTRGAIRRAAGEAGFERNELSMVEGHPAYLVFHKVPFLVGVAYERLLNSTELLAGLRCVILGKLTK